MTLFVSMFVCCVHTTNTINEERHLRFASNWNTSKVHEAHYCCWLSMNCHLSFHFMNFLASIRLLNMTPFLRVDNHVFMIWLRGIRTSFYLFWWYRKITSILVFFSFSHIDCCWRRWTFSNFYLKNMPYRPRTILLF